MEDASSTHHFKEHPPAALTHHRERRDHTVLSLLSPVILLPRYPHMTHTSWLINPLIRSVFKTRCSPANRYIFDLSHASALQWDCSLYEPRPDLFLLLRWGWISHLRQMADQDSRGESPLEEPLDEGQQGKNVISHRKDKIGAEETVVPVNEGNRLCQSCNHTVSSSKSCALQTCS